MCFVPVLKHGIRFAVRVLTAYGTLAREQHPGKTEYTQNQARLSGCSGQVRFYRSERYDAEKTSNSSAFLVLVSLLATCGSKENTAAAMHLIKTEGTVQVDDANGKSAEVMENLVL